jgi:hypothetical protein
MMLTYELHEHDGEFSIYLGPDPDHNPIYFPLEKARVHQIGDDANLAVKYRYDGLLYLGTEEDMREFTHQA